MLGTKKVRFVLVTLLLFVLELASAAHAVPRGGSDHGRRRRPHRAQEIVVKPVVGVSIQTIVDRYQLLILEQLPELNVWRLRIPASASEDAVLDAMLVDPSIDFSDLNYEMTNPEAQQQSFAFVDGTDPPFVEGASPSLYFTQEAYDQIGARAAWAYTTGRAVRVAVVDTGVNRTHPALQNHLRILPGSDFVDRDDNPEDEPGGRSSGHGTFVAGLIARVAADAQIIPVRALNPDGVGDSFSVARAIVYAARDAEAEVINLSIGLTAPAYIIDDALDFAAGRGALLLAAAGNSGSDETQYIASHAGVIGVGAVDGQDVRAPFSNYGACVRVTAPGVTLYSTFINNQFASWSGTSFSTALVSGQAALLKSLRPDLAPNYLAAIIPYAADNIDERNPQYRGRLGYGRINCTTAVDMAKFW